MSRDCNSPAYFFLLFIYCQESNFADAKRRVRGNFFLGEGFPSKQLLPRLPRQGWWVSHQGKKSVPPVCFPLISITDFPARWTGVFEPRRWYNLRFRFSFLAVFSITARHVSHTVSSFCLFFLLYTSLAYLYAQLFFLKTIFIFQIEEGIRIDAVWWTGGLCDLPLLSLELQSSVEPRSSCTGWTVILLFQDGEWSMFGSLKMPPVPLEQDAWQCSNETGKGVVRSQ